MSAYVLPAVLTHAQANACVRNFGLHMRDQGSACVVDASALEHFDSSALSVLLDCGRQAQDQGQRLRVVGMPPRLLALARLYGVQDLLRA